MCIIVSAYFKDKNEFMVQTLKDHIENSLYYNDDGISLVYKDNKDIKVVRDLDITEKKINNILKAVNKKDGFIHCHLRQATTGEVEKDNTHFWEIDNWLFAHNGLVGKFSKNKLGLTDSLLFFKALVQDKALLDTGKIKKDKIDKLVNDLELSGRFILIHKPTNRHYFYGSWSAYCSFEGDSIIISSKSLQGKSRLDFGGLKFDIPYSAIKDIDLPDLDIDGLLRVNADKFSFNYEKKNYTASYGDFSQYDMSGYHYSRKNNSKILAEYEKKYNKLI